MYVAITRAKKRLFLSRPKMKLNYESGRTEYAVESRFLSELFGNLKQSTNLNSSATRSNIYDTGFDSYMSKREKSEVLSQNMSSHINVVNVSGTTQVSSNQNKINPSDYSKYKTGTKVKHPHFGEGIITLGVTDFASAFVTIKFNTVGIKTLSLKYANLEIID